ncbi:MAG: Rrf2 family transcriptional regulator [Puniceicoccaceae bacterium]|nr:MAG: Rrf2 family transcriptional regulator [Puniceicoccaceae bacterium]
MLSLSQTTGYAIVALSRLEGPGGNPRLVKEVAGETGLSSFYLSKIMHQLGKAGLVITKRGFKGGVTLARKPSEISLLDISVAIDGEEWFGRCLLGLEKCSDERGCPAHRFWKGTREAIHQQLVQTNLEEVADFENRAWANQLLEGRPPTSPPTTGRR